MMVSPPGKNAATTRHSILPLSVSKGRSTTESPKQLSMAMHNNSAFVERKKNRGTLGKLRIQLLQPMGRLIILVFPLLVFLVLQSCRHYLSTVLESSPALQQLPSALLPMDALRLAMKVNGISKLEHRPPEVRASDDKKKPILITFANYKGFSFFAHFCETISLALRVGWEVHVLGWGEFHLFSSRAKFSKIPALLTFLKTLPPDQTFLFMDAYDVLVMGGPDEAYEKFVEASTTQQADIIIGAEKVCYPFDKHEQYAKHLCHDEYPLILPLSNVDVDNPYRYLNAGVWMGYADTAIQFLEGMIMIDEMRPRLPMTEGDDQAHFHYAFMSHMYSTSLDYHNALFGAMGSVKEEITFDGDQKRWKHQSYDTYPLTLHFNGNKEGYFDYGNSLVDGEISDYSSITEDVLKQSLHGVDFNRVCKQGWLL